MEKAILKTLIYADIFDYPLKPREIHKWLVGRKVTLRQVEKVLKKLSEKGQVESIGDYYILPRRIGLVRKRMLREKQSGKFFLKAKVATWFLQVIPGIKLVGISGGLAMENAAKIDDIDLFIITSKNRLWLTRLLVCGLLDFMGVRRKAVMKSSQVAGKLCINILLEEDRLEQINKDIYLAHEVLQMRPLWYRGRIYEKYLKDNQWVFDFIPNWVGPQVQNLKFKVKSDNSKSKIVNFLEKIAKGLQLKVMIAPQGMERIEDGALYFHPNDIREEILAKYEQKISRA